MSKFSIKTIVITLLFSSRFEEYTFILKYIQSGCVYDEIAYREGDFVVTKEPCLNCSCQQGALRCHLQVCPYMQELYPPPAGCVLVERKGACCPKLHCRKSVLEPSSLRRGWLHPNHIA